MVSGYIKTGRRVTLRIVCPKCGTVIDLSGEAIFSMAPKEPTSLDEAGALFSERELQVLEIEETPEAITVRPKVFLGRKAFKAISEVMKSAGGHYFSAERASRFIIPKDRGPE